MVVTLFMISQMSLVPNAALSMGIFTMLAVMKNNVPYVVDNFSAVDAIWMVRNTLKDLVTLVNITQVYTSNLLQVKHRSRISDSDTSFIRELYSFSIKEVDMQRAINCKGSKR